MRITNIILIIAVTAMQVSCDKATTAPRTPTVVTVNENNGPYGSVSKWQSIGGDSLFEDELVLTLFYTEPHSPCDICHYQLNYSLWNDYEYTYSTSKCTVPNDTLI